MAVRPIDEKIVVMKLDNSDFTKNAADTTSKLGMLKSALNKIPGVNLGKTAQDLGQIQNAANNTTLERLATSVQSVAGRFSALNVVATTALATIANQATTTALAMANGFTMAPVMDGFREYETKIGSIGTMLSNTEWAGSTLEDVKKTLGELNDYADNTIYNFGEMTSSIGRFTAAGVTLEDSAIAIKGLGNLAAASGSNTEQLNTAMYQMSQALAAGKLNLMDWNSMVNAGMGGKKTQDALVKTAKAMGKNVDLSDGFRNSIEQGWLTSEVFLETLKKFGKDKSMTEAATSVRTFTGMIASLKEGIGSGWASTWEIIFGDFNEATEFWTNMSGAIGGFFAKTTKARNDLLEGIDKKGGIVDIFDGIANATKPLGQLFNAVGNGFKRAFPPVTVDQIIKITGAFNKFTRGLSIAPKELGQITRIFHGVFSIFSSVIIIAKELGKAFLNLIPKDAGGSVLDLLEKVAQMAIDFNLSLKAGNRLTDGIGGLGTVLGVVGDILGSMLSGLVMLTNGFSVLGEAVSEAFSILFDGNFTGKGPWEEDSMIVDWLFNIRDAFKSVGDWFKNNFDGLGISDFLGAGTLAGITVLVGTFVGKIMGLFGSFEDIVDGVTDTFEGIGDAVQNFAMGINIANLVLISIALAVLAGALKTLENIEPQDLAKGITALAVSLGMMMAGMAIMNKFKITGGLRVSATLIALAASISIMADALKKVSDLKPEELKQGMAGLIGVTATIIGAVVALSKWGGKIKVGSIQLIALAGAISIMASAVKKMADIDTGDLYKSVGALALIFLQLGIFLKIVDKTKFGVSSAIGLIAVAGAVHLMVSAIQRIDGIDIKSLTKGLVTITIILGQIVAFSKLISGGKLLLASVGLIALATALNLMVPPILVFSKMSWGEIAKGLTTMALALGLMAGAAMLASGSIGGAAAILIMAAAMNALIIPIKALGGMSWGDILKGIVGLAAGLGLVAGAALLLSPAVVPMLAFGAALLLVGTAVLAVGAGIGLFAMGLATLATLTAASVAAIVSALALMLKGFAELIPGIVNFVVKLGVALINGIMILVPLLANAVAKLIVSLLTTITTYLPSFIEKGTLLLTQLLEGMGKAIPTIITAAIQFMTDLISGMAQGIRDNGPELIGAVMELVGEIVILVIQAGVDIINAVFGWIPGVKTASSSIGDVATKYIRDNFKASDVGSKKGEEFSGALMAKSANAKTAGSKVGQAGKEGVGSADLKAIGSVKGTDFASALSSKAASAQTSGKSLANAGKTGAGSVSMNTTGSNFGSGFASGISGAYTSVVSAAKSLAKAAAKTVKDWLDIHSPSRVTMGFGRFFGEGLALGIDDKVKTVAQSAKTLALQATESLNQFLDGFQLPKEENELKFKAVVDYDKFDKSKFGAVGNLAVAADTSLTSGMIKSIPTKSTVIASESGQNADNSAIIRQQDEQIGLLKQQNQLLSNISNKDNSVYLDGKELYNNNKNIQNNQTNIRNIFKGVSTT